MPVNSKQKLNTINPETIHDDIFSCVFSEMQKLGFNNNGIDNENPKKPRYISHNQMNYILRRVYIKLFKPDKKYMNNEKSLIDYNNTELLQIITDTFIDICNYYNKSLGLISFCYLTGIDYTTILRWLNVEDKSNSRYKVLRKLQETHKAAQVGLLNDSPVGALAVANNDVETGLNWSEKQAAAAASNTIYILPSERLQTLGVKGATAALQPPTE